MGSRKRMVICGGGAIGAAIAYFMSRRGARPIVIERHEVAGAFLALDWCHGSSLDRLARRSFELHAQLSSELGDPWGYRRLTTYSGYAAAGDTARGLGGRPWLAGGVTITGRLGSTESTAVVEPRAFTTGLMRAAHVHGAMLRHGTVVDLVRRPSGAVRGVALASGEIVEGDAVVIAMGPWSILAARWLPLPAVFGYKGHSLVFETGDAIPAEALFLEYREAGGEILTPELFPRADGTTWVCAISTIGPLPVDPADVAADEGAHARLEALCRNISPVLAAAPIKGVAGVLPARQRGRSALHRRRPGCRRCVRGDWPQCVGHAQRAGHRRGHDRTDPGRCGAARRPRAIRARPVAAARSAASARPLGGMPSAIQAPSGVV